jgi:hypothetical protein
LALQAIAAIEDATEYKKNSGLDGPMKNKNNPDNAGKAENVMPNKKLN